MRRLCALVVLVMIVSVPALQLQCTLSCARASAVDVSDDCPHTHPTPDGPAITASGPCCRDAVLSVSVATASGREPLLGPAVAVDQFTAKALPIVDVARAAFVVPWSSGPPGPLVVPLRL